MNSNLREKFLKAMKRESAGYIPLDIALSPPQQNVFEKIYGHRDYYKEWRLPVRGVKLEFTRNCVVFTKWLGALNSRVYVDEWGIGHEKAADGSHFERLLHPLEQVETVEEIENYPFPAPAQEEQVITAINKVEAIKDMGYVAMVPVMPVGGTIFWPCYKLRGMENFLCDLCINEDLTRILINKITDICVSQARLAAITKPDVLILADDLGTQLSTYMSPVLFRRWIKPGLRKVIAAAKEVYPEVLVKFHSDGAIQDFIPDLIEIGIDILNPIQPECMDPLIIKKLYGDRISLNGCIGTQTTLPFGTVQEVRDTTRLYCAEIAGNGGLWIAPTHLVEPEVPWKNIMAFIETAREYE